MSSYGKNQKHLKSRLEEMGQKEHFWPKTTKFWPKINNENFPAEICFHHFLKDQKNRFLWQKSGKFIVAFGRNGPKRAFLAKKGPNFGQKVENENFRQKSEISHI